MEVDPTRMCELLVGLPAVRVLGVVVHLGEPLQVHIETRNERPICGGCGGPVTIKERPVVVLVDVPALDRHAWCGGSTGGAARSRARWVSWTERATTIQQRRWS